MSGVHEFDLLRARIRIPDHVACRHFGSETIVLNLKTGQYHGLNSSGGKMLALLEEHGSLTQAVEAVASEYGVAPDVVSADLQSLCAELATRGLLEIEPANAG